MDKQNFETFIDYGSSKIRLGVFDKSVVKQNFFLEKRCLSDFKLKNFDIEESEKVLEELVLQAEKKVGVHLKNINFPIADIKSFHHFEIGRWDILLNNEKLIKLPQDNYKEIRDVKLQVAF